MAIGDAAQLHRQLPGRRNVSCQEPADMHHPSPVAPLGAGHATHLVPEASLCSPATGGAGLLSCGFGAGTCPVLATLFQTVDLASTEESREWVQKLSPCGLCRVAFDHQRAALRGLRLGQRERDILIAASLTATIDITTPDMSRSLSAARRRAAQSLIKARLLSGSTGKRGRARASMTPLGRYVMAAYGRFIETGKPVRWDRPSSKVPLPGRAPDLLLKEAVDLIQSALRDTLIELNRVLFKAVARPVKDTSQLSDLADHLERKADGLKVLLAAPSVVEVQRNRAEAA